MNQSERATAFAELHKKGDPIIIYNAWDAGSAKAIEAAGAKAIATGDHPVSFSHGFTNDDFDGFTFDTYLATIREIASRVTVPFSVDISNGDGLEGDELKERIRTLLELGVVGVNFEDALDDESGVIPAEDHAAKIRTIREAADEFGVPLFINARSDVFSTAGDTDHSELMDEAVARAAMYKEAGANGFFVPGLMDLSLIKQLADNIDLPLNIIRLPGAPETAELRDAGVSRVSYGPVVQMEMIEWLKEKAAKALQE